MTRVKRPIIGVIIAFLLLACVAAMVTFVPPLSWWIEVPTIILLAGGLCLLASWFTGRKKHGVMVGLFIVITLVLNRLGVLNWITFGLWLLVAGLITLTN